ncbi:MAG: hypothetical protein J3K34DRAFT_274691 [Monoraphidium minutum]|nr:MAG: hypothetical protein J3K34DRAFT_274691 [Monoraphidium minutum]
MRRPGAAAAASRGWGRVRAVRGGGVPSAGARVKKDSAQACTPCAHGRQPGLRKARNEDGWLWWTGKDRSVCDLRAPRPVGARGAGATSRAAAVPTAAAPNSGNGRFSPGHGANGRPMTRGVGGGGGAKGCRVAGAPAKAMRVEGMRCRGQFLK